MLMRSLQEVGYRCQTWESARFQGKDIKPCPNPFNKYLDVVEWTEYDSEKLGLRLMVPRQYLQGTQPLSQYENGKRRFVEQRFKKCGIACLEEHPVRALLLPEDHKSQLLVADSHHRVRYSSKYFIHVLPTVIYSLTELTYIINDSLIKAGKEPTWTEDSLVDKFIRDMGETKESFSGSMDELKQPRPVPIPTIEDLQTIFPSF